MKKRPSAVADKPLTDPKLVLLLCARSWHRRFDLGLDLEDLMAVKCTSVAQQQQQNTAQASAVCALACVGNRQLPLPM
jgi:hypothetical protein